MIVNSINNFFTPYTAENNDNMDKWLKKINNYPEFKKAVLKGKLNDLSSKDKEFLFSFVEKNNIVNEAFAGEDTSDCRLIELLVSHGFDLKLLSSNGELSWRCDRSHLELLSWLWDQNNESLQKELIPIVLSINIDYLNYDCNKIVGDLVSKAISKVSISQILDFKKVHFNNFVKLAKSKPFLFEEALPLFKQLVAEQYDFVIKMGVQLIKNDFSRTSAPMELSQFLLLIERELLSDTIIEGILKNPSFLYSHKENKTSLDKINKIWKEKTPVVQKLIKRTPSFVSAIACLNTLATKTLKELAEALCCFQSIPEIISIQSKLKSKIINHINLLQEKEKGSIWHVNDSVLQDAKNLNVFDQFGLNLNNTDAYGRNLLFTRFAEHIESLKSIPEQIVIDQVDINGENALEYHCRNPSHYGSELKSLTELNLTISPKLPFAAAVKDELSNPHLQALLVACLLNPSQASDLLHNLYSEKRYKIDRIVEKNPDFKRLIGKKLRLGASHYGIHYTFAQKFDEEGMQILRPLIKAAPRNQEKFLLYVDRWKGIVPATCLKVIPESPLCSLLISAIQKAHEEGKEFPSTERMFIGFSHNEMVLFNRYLFKNVSFASIVVKQYFKLNELVIKSGGYSTCEQSAFVTGVIRQTGKLLHIPDIHSKRLDVPEIYCMSEQHQKLINAFTKSIPPSAKSSLDIPEGTPYKLQGRTLILTSTMPYQAFKFLRDDEQYQHFSPEYTVTNLLRGYGNEFRSKFHHPRGVYMVEKIPQFLAKHPELGGNRPAIIYHYTADPEVFDYYSDLTFEKFMLAREFFLHDTPKLVKRGIFPDLASIFHNKKQNRRYIFLMDLVIEILNNRGWAGGPGRLENIEMPYPNIRASGLTDMHDATLLYGEGRLSASDAKDLSKMSSSDKTENEFFYQLNALCNVLLVDMLFLADRFKKEGILQWKNDIHMQNFGAELASGFAQVAAAYSGKDFNEYMTFARGCGIDWTLMATQIAFWLDTSEEGYPSWINQNKVPEGLYDKDAHIKVDACEGKNYDPIKGFSTHGNQDIGVANGPLALTEFEKMVYLLFNPILLSEALL